MGLIYMKTSPSGKSYIGQTIQPEQKRWKAHINSAYNLTDARYNCKISRAIRKYGAENFQTTILEDNIPDNLLNEKEQYYISLYNTFKEGYNASAGGEGLAKLLLHEQKEIVNKWKTGKITIKELSQQYNCHHTTISRLLKDNNITDEDIIQNSRKISGIKHQKSITGYNLLCQPCKHYKSLKEAASYEINGEISTFSKIISRKSFINGLFWFYDEENNFDEIIKIIYNQISNTKSRAIYCITTNKPFRSISDACEYYNLTRRDIIQSCNNIPTKNNPELKFVFYETLFYNIINEQ